MSNLFYFSNIIANPGNLIGSVTTLAEPESAITIYIGQHELALFVCANTHFTN